MSLEDDLLPQVPRCCHCNRELAPELVGQHKWARHIDTDSLYCSAACRENDDRLADELEERYA